MVALAREEGIRRDALAWAVDRVPVYIADDGVRPGGDDPIAVLEISDLVREGRERERVGAEIHLALAPADGERRSVAGANEKVSLALEQKSEREGTAEPRQRRGDGFHRALSGPELRRDE